MRTILAMDYHQWLLATSCLYTPNIVRECAAPRGLVRKLKAQQTSTAPTPPGPPQCGDGIAQAAQIAL